MLVPFFWLVSTSLKPTGREFTYPPEWIPRPAVWRNYTDMLFGPIPFLLLARNTVVIAALSLVGVLLSASLSAFGFARLKFAGRDFWFMMVLATMMLPAVVTLIPTFVLFKELRWIDTWLPLIVPSYFGGGAFNVFLMRQFFLTLPVDLDEAARIDGASSFRIWWQVIMPLSRPVLATIAILNFMGDWDAFIRPLIYITTMRKQMIGVGLAFFRGLSSGYSRWNLLMAAATLMTIPVVVLFFLTQRYFVKGIVMTGIAGR
ncbi:MAG: carbohydrate ABC transporter permease [Anaerolineae bacterium]|nr:carbohydrate ABC transporter permease [Anaerolineae bacterium]